MEGDRMKYSMEWMKKIERPCSCGKTMMRWYHFEYAHDLIGFIEGEQCWTWCCPEEEE